MNGELTVECDIHFQRRGRGWRKELRDGRAPEPPAIERGRVPRVARLMALAIRFDDLLRSGAVSNYSELALLGHVTRPRISQVMALLNLAPDIQEAILFLPRVERGPDLICLRQLHPIAFIEDWQKQRNLWAKLNPPSS